MGRIIGVSLPEQRSQPEESELGQAPGWDGHARFRGIIR